MSIKITKSTAPLLRPGCTVYRPEDGDRITLDHYRSNGRFWVYTQIEYDEDDNELPPSTGYITNQELTHYRCDPWDIRDEEEELRAAILEHWEAIASYMDDETREAVHGDRAPCTEIEFLREYLERDPDFSRLLWMEFDIDTDLL